MKYFALLIKALLPRFLFLGHGVICIWIAYLGAYNRLWWLLSSCLVLIVIEGVFNVIVRKGKEFDWFCPSAFFYSIVLLTTLVSLRNDMVDCLDKICLLPVKDPNWDPITRLVLENSIDLRASIIEQTGVLVLIIGRWTLPKGSISRNQFSQILLIYVGTAADIVEFSELYGEEKVRDRSERNTIYRGVMVVWGWSILQFSLTIALPEEGLKQDEDDIEEDPADVKWRQTNRVAPMSYLHYKAMLTKGWDAETQRTNPANNHAMQWRGKFEANGNDRGNVASEAPVAEEEETGCGIGRGDLKTCILNNLELITCLIPVLMQDGPFFVYRMVLVVKYSVVTQMIILLTVKNALVIIVQIYRIMILYCSEPKEEGQDLDDASIRVRAALKATNRMSKRTKNFRGSVAIQAISRMQVQYLQKEKSTPANTLQA